jgi:hypothetical protein
MVANLVKRYKIHPGSTGLPSYEKSKGNIAKVPQSHKIRLERRD